MSEGFARAGEVKLTLLADGRTWRLERRVLWRRRYEGDAATGDGRVHVELRVEAPAGTTTDLASTPRLLWPIMPPSGRYAAAAVIHDTLYRNRALPRVICDAIFLAAMRDLSVKPWRRFLMWLGVRLFGASSYRIRR